MRGAVLCEAHDPQSVRAPDGSLVGLQRAFQQPEQRGLSAAVRSHQAGAHTGRKSEIQVLEQPAPA